MKRVGDSVPVMSISNLLGLDRLNVEVHPDYPNGEIWLNDNLRISHGTVVREGSGDTVKKILDSCRCSEIVGHIHRCEYASKTAWRHDGPVTYAAASPGTLCRLDGPVPKYNARVNWQNGCAVVDYEEGNGGFDIHIQQIYKGETVFRGQRIVGVNRLEQLKEETGYNF